MVFFICDVCQETLKKSAVDKHCQRCRDCWYLSCVDCGKVFAGEEYRTHTSCISEAEKYQGALYRGNKKKKADPQEKWMNSVSKAAATAKGSSAVIDMLRYLSNQENVPRKEKKFMNYLKNSYRQAGSQRNFKAVWDIIHKIHVDGDTSVNQNQNNEKKRSADTANIDANATKKQKVSEDKQSKDIVNEEKCGEGSKEHGNEIAIKEWKSWKSVIRTTLRNQGRQGKLKKIRKIVLKLYKKFHSNESSAKESVLSKKDLKVIFGEKCNKDKRVEVSDDGEVLRLL